MNRRLTSNSLSTFDVKPQKFHFLQTAIIRQLLPTPMHGLKVSTPQLLRRKPQNFSESQPGRVEISETAGITLCKNKHPHFINHMCTMNGAF